MGTITLPCDAGDVSDGYHTFNELYEHRCLLFVLWLNREIGYTGRTFKTWQDQNGGMLENWFIAGTMTPFGQISYHLPARMWKLVKAREIERNMEYDGHTSADVLARLQQLAEE